MPAAAAEKYQFASLIIDFFSPIYKNNSGLQPSDEQFQRIRRRPMAIKITYRKAHAKKNDY
jgi:hypothetical protein